MKGLETKNEAKLVTWPGDSNQDTPATQDEEMEDDPDVVVESVKYISEPATAGSEGATRFGSISESATEDGNAEINNNKTLTRCCWSFLPRWRSYQKESKWLREL